MFINMARSCGAELHTEEFDCLDYDQGEVILRCGDESFTAFASPFSYGCDLHARLLEASSFDQLAGMDLRGAILLLHGEIASSQIMPKNFVFYNPEEHKRLVSLLESSGVAALITSTPRQPELNGALYPLPMFEDGDFHIPSVFMTLEEGERLLARAGRDVTLSSTARRIPVKAMHVQAAYGDADKPKILLCSHIDSKKDAPGALDNAGGTLVIMSLLHMLKGYNGSYRIELVPFNGEDYYAAPSEMIYLKDFDYQNLELCLNFDGIGLKGYRTGLSHFNLDPELEARLDKAFSDQDKYCRAEPWYQGDHAIFAMQGRPAVAFCSENLQYLFSEITHTSKDRPELVDLGILRDIAERVCSIVVSL
jgi:aminopeptidase YwaD